MNPTLKKFANANWFIGHLYAYRNLLVRKWRLGRGEKVLFNAELFFDAKCNLQCRHCSIARSGGDNKPFMNFAEITRVADELKRVNCFLCCLVGGEPMLREDLEDIVALFHARKILPTLITNGLLLDQRRINGLRRSGIFSVGVSLNGSSQEEHDRFVGSKGAFEGAMRAIRLLKEARIPTSIAVVPTHESLASGGFDALIRLAAELGLRVNVNYPALAGQFTARYDELLTADEIRRVREYFKLQHVSSDFTVLADRYECPAGRKKIYIFPNGEVTPCTFIHISFGNILKEPIEKVLERLWSCDEFMKRRPYCLVGESESWNKKFLAPVFESSVIPLPYTEHPELGAIKKS